LYAFFVDAATRRPEEAMLTWDGLLDREVICLRCRSTAPIAGPLPADLQLELGAVGKTLEAVRLIRQATGCD
jgi:hypothetical protein